jgi:hypothetical protein
MTHTRMDEAAINASLDACLHGAREGDSNQARRLHELLDLMLMERETEDGKLKPRQGHWRDTCEYLHDLRVAIAVANELCEQRTGGGKANVSKAAKIVADRGEFELEAGRIREVYEEVASTLGGFREIAHC